MHWIQEVLLRILTSETTYASRVELLKQSGFKYNDGNYKWEMFTLGKTPSLIGWITDEAVYVSSKEY